MKDSASVRLRVKFGLAPIRSVCMMVADASRHQVIMKHYPESGSFFCEEPASVIIMRYSMHPSHVRHTSMNGIWFWPMNLKPLWIWTNGRYMIRKMKSRETACRITGHLCKKIPIQWLYWPGPAITVTPHASQTINNSDRLFKSMFRLITTSRIVDPLWGESIDGIPPTKGQ